MSDADFEGSILADFAADAREHLTRSALEHLAAIIEETPDAGEVKRIGGILAEKKCDPAIRFRRINVAIVDNLERLEAEARNSKTSAGAPPAGNP